MKYRFYFAIIFLRYFQKFKIFKYLSDILMISKYDNFFFEIIYLCDIFIKLNYEILILFRNDIFTIFSKI